MDAHGKHISEFRGKVRAAKSERRELRTELECLRALTWRAIDAIVEEGFPTGALDNPALFFDAEGDPAKFDKNLKTMMDSVGRFIDMSRIDVTPSSQYCMF